jgi:hypothetical protein
MTALETSASAIAAERAHLERLQRAHEHGCHWDLTETCRRASVRGDSELLGWAQTAVLEAARLPSPAPAYPARA